MQEIPSMGESSAMKNDFPTLLKVFLTDYLQVQRGASMNTVSTYRDAFVGLIEFLSVKKGIRPAAIQMKDFCHGNVIEFLDWLETEKKLSVSTRNNRLGAIRSFCNFLCYRAPEHLAECSSILEIRQKKGETAAMNYLTIEAYQHLLSVFDLGDRSELRDMALITLMYESGGRVSEVIGIHSGELKRGENCTLLLHDKGKKSRIVPINKGVAKLVDNYRKLYSIQDDEFLFFNGRREPLTRKGVDYILKKYFARASLQHPELFPDKISPHCIRHSRAMHLLEKGVPLIYIRDILGHESVQTTEIYSKANPEVKRKHLEAASMALLDGKSEFTEEKKSELLSWLKENL